jgi:hypothetical protein
MQDTTQALTPQEVEMNERLAEFARLLALMLRRLMAQRAAAQEAPAAAQDQATGPEKGAA